VPIGVSDRTMACHRPPIRLICRVPNWKPGLSNCWAWYQSRSFIVVAQRDEIARLKGLKRCPSIKPSGMEKGTEPKSGGKRSKRRRRGKVTPRVAPVTEVLRVAHPAGSQFKGYQPYQVQDLVIGGGAVSARALADTGGRDSRGAAAKRHPRPFRAGAAPLRADAASPEPGPC
jgi:hypothetical protein